jgi:hypothetical protein
MNATDTPYFAVPLGREAHAIAQQRAMSTPSQWRKRIYLNTLAIAAVQSYLNWLQIESKVSAQIPLFDFATLMIPSMGQIECRPVLPGDTSFSVPPEATVDRIGYVAIQLNAELNEGQILGFLDAVAYPDGVEDIAIAELASIEELLEKLSVRSEQATIQLNRWLDHQFERGWQGLEALLNSLSQPTLSYRNSDQGAVSGGRLIDLGMQLRETAIALVITLSPEVQGVMNICVQVCAIGKGYLPADLRLAVMDQQNQAIREVPARGIDNLIQLSFDGSVGEPFRVKVMLGEMQVIEDFTI